MNWIEQLLEKIEDVEARQQFSGLVEKHQAIGDFVSKAEDITRWAETEWDYDHGMSKLEYRQQQELETLQGQLNTRKDGMELNELNDYLGKYIKDNGLLTRTEVDAQIKAKEEAFNNELNLVSTLATRVSYLNGKYQKEFGEMFDPDDFITKANEKGYSKFGKEGLDKFYTEFTAEKAEAKRSADIDAKIAAAKEEGKREAMQARVAGPDGSGMPTLDGSPEMGHFEQKMRGLGNKPIDPNASTVPAEVELGRGVGKYAAAQWDQRDRAKGLVQ